MVEFPPSLADFMLSTGEAYECVTREFEKATTSTQRAHILEIYVMSMRLVINGVDPQQKEKMEKSFQESYYLFLVLEARKGDFVDPELMEMITAREVLAGRMDANDELRTMSVSTSNEIRAQKKSATESVQTSRNHAQSAVRKSWLPWRK